MSDHRTEPLDSYEDESYDWDYDEEPQRGPKILWGRVLLLGIFLILAFLLGRATAGSGVPQERVDDLRTQIAEKDEEISRLQAAQETEPTPEVTTEPSPDETVAVPEGETYVVRRGDTLRGIAEDFYQNAALDDCIAEANGIDDPEALSVGAELTIPPEEAC